ncbi:MAG TPA: ABC transporter substrate-binding protein [Candidatus Acidoferrum sp.]|nr:ABC transporter substrate-binding protein [Candidatus Acidoferrum sp.]
MTNAARVWPGRAVRYLAIGLLALAWGATAAPRIAGAADDPKAFVQRIGDQVVKVLQQNLPREKTGEQLNAIWLASFDVDGIGRAVLGKNWKKATDEQRRAYMELFPKYVAKLYAIQFSDYSGETFAVKGSRTTSDGAAIVNAEIDQPQSEPIKLDFIVQNVAQGLKVTDVKVEGVSLLVTKRSEFDSVVAQKGIDGLIQAMRQKVGESLG